MHQESFFPLVWSLVFVADCPMILDFSFECRLGLRLFRPCRWQTCFSMKLYNGLWALSRVDVGLSMAPVICRCTKINEMLLLSAILFIPITTTEWARIDLYHFLLCSLKNDLWQREVAGGWSKQNVLSDQTLCSIAVSDCESCYFVGIFSLRESSIGLFLYISSQCGYDIEV